MKFCTLKEASTAEIVEKKSRFIANSCHIESKEEAEEKINLIKKKYYDAKHNCFSFSIVDKDGNLLEKSSDDGEPSGTAGAPILNVIRKNNLNNVLIVVTRYFGGILLGTGGLTRAYSNTALASIENGKIIEVENLAQAIKEMRKHHFKLMVTSLQTKNSIYDIDFYKKMIVIGNEANGVSKEIQDMADEKAKIPMLGRTESLNASVAAGVVMYEYVRQKLNK